ncbi:MAG TPA: D-ribose ABC transporter substrate-binding protein [Rubrobacteraceae bacterium]|nr:D-ribose ABC transporter substrate-binding protein [Rubrobacteraceae bacterium]
MRTRATMLLAMLLLAVLATALAAGCQRGGGEGGGARIGLSVSTLNNPFFVTLRDGAQSAADEAGAELIVSDAQNDTAQQQDDIQNFVTQQVNVILVNPVDSDAVVPAIEAANQANIPVIALDRGASGGELATTIASDNVQGGNLAGEELIRLVGSGSVAQLEGTPGADPARDRGQGFQDAIDAQSAVEVVASQSANFDRAEGLNVAENILQANPNIAGIFAQNDEMALGAVQALGDSAGDEVKVVGFDAIEDALSAIQDGTINATVAQQPAEIGSLGVENAIRVINGESVEENIPVEVQLVTPENVSEFL